MEWWAEAQIVVLATPIYLILIGGEIVLSHLHNRPCYTLKGTLTNCYLAALSLLLDVATRGVCFAVLLFFHQFHAFAIAIPWLYWAVLLLLQDFAFYAMHVFEHKCRAFWAVHVTHHSSEEFNLTIGVRSSVLQPLYRFIGFIPLALLGFQPADILLMFSITQIYGVLNHTKSIRTLGPFEWFMATPSHHRVHHGSNPQYLDKNMGMVFIVWDRLFGTFEPEREEVVYGLTRVIDAHDPVTVIFHEWREIWVDVRNARTFRDRLGYLLGPPGWSHDGSRESANRERFTTHEAHHYR